MIFGVRFRSDPSKPWRRVRTRTNRNGEWRATGAEYIAGLLRRRGGQAHKFEITMYPNRERYSPHFTRAELECKCGCATPLPIQQQLARLAQDLERMRAAYGRAIAVISGYRCPAYNKKIGGASNSQHMKGTAADIASNLQSQAELRDAALKVPAFKGGGIGTYPAGGLHVDRRGWVARWTSF